MGMGEIQARFHLARPSFTLDVDLTLPGRGITVLFGPSGSGKTTLLRCIAGLEQPREGYLRFQGERWQEGSYCLPTHHRPIGYVFQEASLFPHLTVLENLRFGLRRNTQARPADLEAAIALLELTPLLGRNPAHLSGGGGATTGGHGAGLSSKAAAPIDGRAAGCPGLCAQTGNLALSGAPA